MTNLLIARLFAGASGYYISTNPPEAARAGYKNWFIQDYRRPGYTIEAGLGKSPLFPFPGTVGELPASL